MKTNLSKIIVLVCFVAPLAGFTQNPTSLITFTNPTPAANDFFSSSVVAVGSNRILIGASSDNTGAANAGAAYLFSTTGALLATLTNPTPIFSDSFGYSAAAVGTDALLIGAPARANSSGIAHLLNTNGALITTFPNPTYSGPEFFGISVAAVGTDSVLIGAPGEGSGGFA